MSSKNSRLDLLLYVEVSFCNGLLLSPLMDSLCSLTSFMFFSGKGGEFHFTTSFFLQNLTGMLRVSFPYSLLVPTFPLLYGLSCTYFPSIWSIHLFTQGLCFEGWVSPRENRAQQPVPLGIMPHIYQIMLIWFSVHRGLSNHLFHNTASVQGLEQKYCSLYNFSCSQRCLLLSVVPLVLHIVAASVTSSLSLS